MTEPTHRVVAGLSVPLPLVMPLIEAFRSEYATVTEEIEDDEAAVRAVLKHLTAQILITHRTRQVHDAGQAQVDAAIAAAGAAVESAQRQALAAAALITDAIEPPPVDPEVPA